MGADQISAYSIWLCFSVLYPFISYLSYSFCKPSVYQIACFTRTWQRDWVRKGKGNSPSLFCLFDSFCNVTKGTAFSFSLEEEHSSILLSKIGLPFLLSQISKAAFPHEMGSFSLLPDLGFLVLLPFSPEQQKREALPPLSHCSPERNFFPFSKEEKKNPFSPPFYNKRSKNS